MNLALALLTLMTPCLVLANSSADIIKDRQQHFVHIEQQLDKASESLDGSDTDWAQLEITASQLKASSEDLQHSFPQGSQDGSKANEKVWQQPAEFGQLMNEMDQGFEELYRAAKQQNAELAEQGIDAAQQTCRSCHRSYRSRW